MVHTLSLVPRHKLRHAKRAHFYIRFDVCASASRTDIKKLSAHNVCTQRSLWSEWRDLNSRPYGPEPYALPNCATPRYYKFAFTSTVASLGARRAFPLGLAFFTVDLKSYLFLVFRSFCFRSYRKPNCATPRYYKFAFTSTVASLGARRAFPLGLAFFTVDLKSYLFLVFRSFCFRSYRKPNCATPR